MASVLPTLSPPLQRRRLSQRQVEPALALPVSSRLSLIEAGRGMAACLIVAHHLSAYGTMPDLAAEVAPGLMGFLFDYARMAVQVFLVFGGFSLAWMLGDKPLTWQSARQTFFWRYLRLVIPYAVVIVLLLLTARLIGTNSHEPKLIDSFSWPQLAAHAVFLQDVLGYGNFSAGTWYLCIDLQFALLFLAIAAVGQTVCRQFMQRDATPTLLCLVLVPLGVCSAWFWNRTAGGDAYVPYFLAPMVLGALVAWFLRGKIPLFVLAVYIALVTASLAIDFRPRLVIALATGFGLLLLAQSAIVEQLCRPFAPLGRISYSLFLIHYLVNWLVFAAIAPFVGEDPIRAIAALIMAFFISLTAAVALYYAVERPAQNWLQILKRTSTAK